MIKVLNVRSLYSALYKTVDFCKKNEGETIEIIVPDKLSLFMEKFLFEHMNMLASFKIKVSTLNRFAKKSCFVDKEKQISKIGSVLLIHKILNDNHDSLEVLNNKAYSFSYAEDIFKTIGQLKASKIGFEEMLTFSSSDERLSGKIKDLARVYQWYEEHKAGLLDASDLFLMSTFNVAKGKEKSKLIFVGFDDFTAIEYSIIEQLAMVAEVNVINYSSKESNKFIFNSEIISQLRNVAYINQLPFEVEDCEVVVSELKNFMECNLYALTDNKKVLTDEIVKVYSGNNVQDEIEFVARDIRCKILSGQRYDEFGVAVFGLENHLSKIKEIFEKYEINYYLDNEICINKSVLYKFYVSVLKYNFDGYNLSNLIDLVNSPFFTIETNKKREIIQSLIAVKFRGKVKKDINLNLDEELKVCFVDFMNHLIFDSSISSCDLVNKLRELDVILNLEGILCDLSSDVNNKILLNKSKSVLFSIFDDILQFYPDADANKFFDIFMHVSAVVKINNLPLSLDCVKIVDANNFCEVFNELYLVDATHENAPSLKYDCGIILDTEIEKLNFSNKLSPTIAHINKLAKLRLFNSILMFEKELTLTYSNSKSDIIKDITAKIQVATKEGIKNIVPINKLGFEKYVAMSKWDYIESMCSNGGKNLEQIENIVKNKEFKQISNENLKIFENFTTVSATTLENYFKCPLFAFMQNVLKIKPRIEADILSFDIGNVLHEIMFMYYKRNKNVGDVYEFCKNQVFKFVERDERLKLNLNSPILINLIDEAVRVINAINYIDDNSLFQTNSSLVEYDFSNEKALPLKNILIKGKVDRVDVRNDMFRIVDYKSGKADANLKELYYGNKLQLFLYSCAMERVLKKRAVGSFYLPLHNAYTKELGNTYSLKGFYLAEDFVVQSFDKRLCPGEKSDIVNVKLNKDGTISKLSGFKELGNNEFNHLKNYSIKVSEQAVEEIKSGYIAPSPNDVSNACEFCPYIQVCLKNSNNVATRCANTVLLESFEEAEDERI